MDETIENVESSTPNGVKVWLVQVFLRKVIPAASAAGVSTLASLWATYHGKLESFGLTYGTWPLSWPTGQDPTGPVILVELDTVGPATLTLIAFGVAALVRTLFHHTGAAVKKTPQSGDQRGVATDGQRSTDS